MTNVEIPSPPDMPDRQKTRLDWISSWREAGGIYDNNPKTTDDEIIDKFFIGNRRVSGGLELNAKGLALFGDVLPFYDFELKELPTSDQILMLARNSPSLYGLYRRNNFNFIRFFDREMAAIMDLCDSNLKSVTEGLYGTAKENREKTS
jgi:hypothetical protein